MQELKNSLDIAEVTVQSTSRVTAKISPIKLNETDRIQLIFEPELIESSNQSEMCLEGTFIYQKKSIHDEVFPTETLSRGSIVNGQVIKLKLSRVEMMALYIGLTSCYDIYKQLGGVPNGFVKFVKETDQISEVAKLIKSSPELIEILPSIINNEIALDILKHIANDELNINLQEVLSSLDKNEIDKIDQTVSIEKLLRIKFEIESNLNNGEEEFWQKLFTENQWIISELISVPITIFSKKAYYGGKNIHNRDGNLGDFLYKNQLTGNTVIVEIKTPNTKIMGNKYRNNIYSVTEELTGSINQLLKSKDQLLKEYFVLKGNSDEEFNIFEPKCVLIVGRFDKIDADQISSFELFRNTIKNVQIITYDELLQKINNLINLFVE